jgi:DNA-binding CsgD family transcriptional regulator/tetratricopeptide (TPR) repeat protein
VLQDVIGREPELAEIQRILSEDDAGYRALRIDGEAGIGKTTLWRAGIDMAHAAGYTVLTARAAQAETELSYAVLGDLLGPIVEESLSDLPQPQRSAVEVALLEADATDPDLEERAVGLGCLAVLRSIARRSKLLVAIDDLQWIDASSARVLRFALRRLHDERIVALGSLRIGGVEARDRLGLTETEPEERMTRLRVGPMSVDGLRRLILERIDATLPRSVLQRIQGVSAGNPFFALQIAAELERRGGPTASALPIPGDVRELLHDRLRALPKATREVLLVAAAAARPTHRLVVDASRSPARAPVALAKAERAGLIHVQGAAIDFDHPLLASSIYESASTEERRRVHARLAARVGDIEERARHLALAAEGPDPAVAAALDDAATRARSRGAPEAAAELSELARTATPPGADEALRRRTVDAAGYHFDAGDVATSSALFEEAIGSAPPGRARAEILFACASHGWMDLDRVGRFCQRTLEEAEGDRELAAQAHEHLAWVGIYRGDLARAAHHAERAVALAETSPAASRAEALATYGMTQFLLGRPADDVMAESDRLQLEASAEAVAEVTVFTSARTNHGLQLLWAGELDAARTILQEELAAYERLGRYVVRDEVLDYLAELECRAGNYGLAERYADEAYEIDVESGRVSGEGHTLFNTALVSAHRGRVARARADAEEGVRISIANDDPFYANCNRAVLGFLELSLSDPAAALSHLSTAVEYVHISGAAEPAVIPCVPDAIECLVAVGEVANAERLLEAHEEKGRLLDRPWALATAGRCRALLLAARGDVPAALAELDRALVEHYRTPQPFETGRTLLVRGEVARRGKRKALARSNLDDAKAIFDRLGAPLWSSKAEAELVRAIGVASGADLTPTERRVADLAAEGRTNREIGDALFISVKTVEANLSRVFRKLGVRSRAELIRRMVGRSSMDEPAPSDGSSDGS